ncbi:hypothetical protein [Flavobacterium anhuiense]|uniref:hypothetical protein n=1 Tax=Flavobacterium anhuiense TaxID=459526 RepID=UPI003D9697D6
MSHLRTAHTTTELTAIFEESGMPEKYFDQFLMYYETCFKDFLKENEQYRDEDFAEGESVQSDALIVTKIHIELVMKEISKGHGDEWAFAIANCTEEDERAHIFVYNELKNINPELAKKELLILCKSYSGDDFFEKYFISKFEKGCDYFNYAKRARKYSEIYKKKLTEGKSKIYAHQYADLIANEEFSKIYCEEYAYAYDKAISEAKSEEYAVVFADQYGSALVDIKSRYGISDDEEMINFEIEKVNIFMKAWAHNQELQLTNFKRFADIYEQVHMKTYYNDQNKSPVIESKEINKDILERTLHSYMKLEDK